MTIAVENKQILERLNEIKSELDFIKNRIIDMDCVLTDEDISSIEEAEQDLKQGKTKRL